jgi:hypothetical protein
VLVLYEDIPARNAAVELCDHLTAKFGAELEFEFTWWGFRYLSEEEIAKQAAGAALTADLILVSVPHAEDLPLEVKAWFERWLSDREPAEGALVVLETSGDNRQAQPIRDPYLQLVALRAKMDYLPLREGQIADGTNGFSTESFVSPRVMDLNGSQRQEDHYTGWGIND